MCRVATVSPAMSRPSITWESPALPPVHPSPPLQASMSHTATPWGDLACGLLGWVSCGTTLSTFLARPVCVSPADPFLCPYRALWRAEAWDGAETLRGSGAAASVPRAPCRVPVFLWPCALSGEAHHPAASRRKLRRPGGWRVVRKVGATLSVSQQGLFSGLEKLPAWALPPSPSEKRSLVSKVPAQR